jgi:hypothetical protein
MECVVLNSRLISSAAYHPRQKRLTLWFKSGRSRSYAGVESKIFDVLKEAESPGFFYEHHIARQYQRLDGDKKTNWSLPAAVAALGVTLATSHHFAEPPNPEQGHVVTADATAADAPEPRQF